MRRVYVLKSKYQPKGYSTFFLIARTTTNSGFELRLRDGMRYKANVDVIENQTHYCH